MTKEEAIDLVIRVFDALEGECNIEYDWREEHEARDMAIKALEEQESVVDRDCEHCSKTYGSLGCCDTVSNKWVYSCKEGQREYILNKIRAEIMDFEEELFHRPNTDYTDYAAVRHCVEIVEKYKESEGER